MTEAVGKRMRTCIGCGMQSDKVRLLRIVRGADGSVCFDATGKMPGRGAYVCSPDCMRVAARSKKVQRALRTNVRENEIERIIAEIEEAARSEEIR